MKLFQFPQKLAGVIAGFTLFTIHIGQAGAVVMTFTDRASWEAALGSTTFFAEDLNGTTSSFSPNSTENPIGVLTTLEMNGPSEGSTGPTGLAGKGFLEGRVDGKGSNALSLTINTPSIFGLAILGLQNDSIRNPAGLDLQEIGIRIEGVDYEKHPVVNISSDHLSFSKQ